MEKLKNFKYSRESIQILLFDNVPSFKLKVNLKQFFYPRGLVLEARWPHGLCARFQVEFSGFEPWPATYVVFLNIAFLRPGVWIDTVEFNSGSDTLYSYG